MKSARIILVLSLILGLAFTACQDHSNIIRPQKAAPSSGLGLQGVTLDSANFYIYVDVAGNQTVNVHRITADWAENTVTWNNFNGQFDSDVVGSFVSSAPGWYSVDISSLVEGWMDGTFPNYGLLIEQGLTAFTTYHSSEFTTVELRPFLRIGYTTNDGPTVVVIQRGTNLNVADSYIWESTPDDNYGTSDVLYTGDVGGVLKQSLLKFDMPETPPPPPSGCTRTIGYWKTHAGFGPQADVVTPLLPIVLGTSDGDSSLHVTSALIAYRVLGQHYYGEPSNGITKLYAQLLGAKLNIASGADDADIAETITAADNFLATHTYFAWSGLSSSDKQMVLGWHEMLDDYNEGVIGPGHCDDEEFK